MTTARLTVGVRKKLTKFSWGERLDATQTSMGLPARFLRTTSFLCSAMPNAARAGVPCCVGDACDVCGVWDGAFSLHHRGPLRYALLLRQTANRPALLPTVAEHPMKLRQISSLISSSSLRVNDLV